MRTSRVSRAVRHGASGSGATGTLDYSKVATYEEKVGSGEKCPKNQLVEMEILRSCRQATDVTGSHSQFAVAAGKRSRSLGAGQLHQFGCRCRRFQVSK